MKKKLNSDPKTEESHDPKCPRKNTKQKTNLESLIEELVERFRIFDQILPSTDDEYHHKNKTPKISPFHGKKKEKKKNQIVRLLAKKRRENILIAI